MVQLSENQRNVIFDLLHKYTPVQVKILMLLSEGKKTTRDIAQVLYNDTAESELENVRVHICHLRKRMRQHSCHLYIAVKYNDANNYYTKFNKYYYYLDQS